MRRILIALAALSFFTAAFSAAAQSLPSKSEVASILQKGFSAMDLRSPGSPPFHFVARVHYDLAGSSTDGTYEMLWLAPDRSREDLKLDGVGSETEIVNRDKIINLRTNFGTVLPLHSIRGVLLPDHEKPYAWNLKAKRIQMMPMDGEQRVCIESEASLSLKQTACLDSSGQQVGTLRYVGFLHSGEQSDFVSVGEKRYPRHFATRQLDETMDIRLEFVAVPQEGIESALEAPAGAVVRDWCLKEEVKEPTAGPASPFFTMRAPGAMVMYYVLVDTNGHVKDWAPLRKESKAIDDLLESPYSMAPVLPQGFDAPLLLNGKYLGSIDKTLAAWFPDAKFPKRSCGGKPIEYEHVMPIPAGIPVTK